MISFIPFIFDSIANDETWLLQPPTIFIFQSYDGPLEANFCERLCWLVTEHRILSG